MRTGKAGRCYGNFLVLQGSSYSYGNCHGIFCLPLTFLHIFCIIILIPVMSAMCTQILLRIYFLNVQLLFPFGIWHNSKLAFASNFLILRLRVLDLKKGKDLPKLRRSKCSPWFPNGFWTLWLNRNNVRFRNHCANPHSLVNRALALMNENFQVGPDPEETTGHILTQNHNIGAGNFNFILQHDGSFLSSDSSVGTGFIFSRICIHCCWLQFVQSS